MLSVNPSLENRRVNTSQAAAYLGFATHTLANWRSRGVGPRSVRIAGKVFYSVADLDAFVAKGLVRGGDRG